MNFTHWLAALIVLGLGGYTAYYFYKKRQQEYIAQIDTPAKLVKLLLAEFKDQLSRVPADKEIDEEQMTELLESFGRLMLALDLGFLETHVELDIQELPKDGDYGTLVLVELEKQGKLSKKHADALKDAIAIAKYFQPDGATEEALEKLIDSLPKFPVYYEALVIYDSAWKSQPDERKK